MAAASHFIMAAVGQLIPRHMMDEMMERSVARVHGAIQKTLRA